MIKQVRIFVRGSVIGVGFRAWVKYQSKFVKVSGWVRNVGEEVEVLLQGEEKEIKNMIERIKKGPPTAVVLGTEEIWEPQTEIFNEFKVLK